MIAALDLGNSRAKLFFVGKPQPLVFEYNDSWPASLLGELKRQGAGRSLNLGISSVNPAAHESLRVAWNTVIFGEMIEARRLLILHSPINFGAVTGMGDDRKLGLIGALIVGPPPLITIDCGTAITINTVDANGVCRGGAILPGFDTQMRALNDYTGALPRLSPRPTSIWRGASTEQAIMVGVVRGAAGAVANICRNILLDLGPEPVAGRGSAAHSNVSPTVFVTGGAAELLYSQLQELQFNTRLLPDLVGAGLLALLKSYKA